VTIYLGEEEANDAYTADYLLGDNHF